MSSQMIQKITMLKRWAKIVSGKTEVAVRQDVGRSFSKDCVSGYYNDLTGKVSPNTLLDEDGIPLTVIAGGEKRHFPIAVFQYALGCYDLFLQTGDECFRERFESCARWAVSNQKADGSWDAFGPIGSTKYTVSSMCQGEGASVLARAFVCFGDFCYIQAAKRAVNFMLVPVGDGGTSFYEGGALRLEEYPQMPRRTVLNGWIFSIFGLYDLCKIDDSYQEYLSLTVETLANDLGNYDSGYWSYYDLEKRIASPAYHLLHIALLDVMYQLFGLDAFARHSSMYNDYQNSKVNQVRAISKKAVQKVFEKSDAVIVQ